MLVSSPDRHLVGFIRAALIGLALTIAFPAAAQQQLRPIGLLPIHHDPLTIVQPSATGKPFTVAGERGAILGEQDGHFEAWLFPVKVLSHFTITAQLQDYPLP